MCNTEYTECNIIYLNNYKTSELPVVFIPELNAKFLVDTGSGKSFINPNLAYQIYPEFISNENFSVRTAHATSFHNEIVHIPIFPSFKINKYHKFYLFDFSEKFDGLLGIDFLIDIGAKINLNNLKLETTQVNLPLYLQTKTPPNNVSNKNKNQFPQDIIIPARVTQKVKVPVNKESGVGILNYHDFNGAEMPDALVTIIDSHAHTVITNVRENPIKITILNPFEIEPIDELDCNFIEKMETDTELKDLLNKKQKQNLKKLRLNHCNKEEFKAIRNLCSEYRDIFYCEDIPLTFTNQIKHNINLTEETPIFTKTYRYPQVHKSEVNKQVNQMLKDGIIQPSNSPWSSPIWVVPKKADASGHKKWRIVIDFRKLNNKTIDDKFPLPNITDILDKLGKAQYFSTLDLANGFHQIEMNPHDIPKTAFSTETGHYEFKRMPFGLKNAPSTFQRVMNNVLRGLQNEICCVYLDDVIVYSTSLQEHINRLKLIFERFRQSNFKVQLDKSEFLHKEVAYLGHKITKEGVKPDPAKIDAVKNFPIPTTQKEIKSFLGLAGYYRRFIKDFAKISKPLTLCLKKNAKVVHNQSFRESFNHLKKLLINAPILRYPDFTQTFVLTTDASNIAIGAVLSQSNPPNDNPVAYASRTLNETEQRYSTIEKELLAIVWACRYFRPYLYGRKFKIFTDHRPLVWLFNLKEPNSKLIRWRLKLEEYDYEIIYKSGKQNLNADALSRISLHALETESTLNNPGDIDLDIDKFLNDLTNNPQEGDNTEISKIIEELERPTTSRINIIQDIRIPAPTNTTDTDTVHTANANETLADMSMLDEIINSKSNQLIVKKSPYNAYTDQSFENLEGKKITNATIPADNESVLKFLKEHLKDKTTYIYFHSKELRPIFHEVMTKHFGNMKLVECTKLVNNVKPDERDMIIRFSHEGKTNHRGIQETLKRIKINYFWKSMKDDITNFINNCEICQRAKYNRRPPDQPLVLTETPSKPFEIIHIDTLYVGKQKFLTFIDKFSKFGHALPHFGTAISVCQNLVHFFSFFGVPKQIVSDNGTEFKNDVVSELLKSHNIKIHFTTPQHHESNGPVERLNSTLVEHLRILREKDNNTDIITLMSYAVIAYNSTIHSSTNFTPYELVFGHTDTRDPMLVLPAEVYTEYATTHRTNTEALYNKVQESSKTLKQKIIDKRNLDKKNTELIIGSKVYKKQEKRLGKLHPKHKGPFILTKVLENNKIEIKNPKTNQKEIVHVNETKIIPIVADGSDLPIPEQPEQPEQTSTN